MLRVGVLEDDVDVADFYRVTLTHAGYDCSIFGTVRQFGDALARQPFDLLLVDWTLPDGTSAHLIQDIRRDLGWHMPIIVVSAHEDEKTIVEALRAGADDYVIKPLRMTEVGARIEAMLRRNDSISRGPTRFGPYEIEHDERRIRLSGRMIDLTEKEFLLVNHLFMHRGKLITRSHLLDVVWGQTADIDTRTVDTHISRLRKKLALNGEHGWTIISIYGSGYRLESVGQES